MFWLFLDFSFGYEHEWNYDLPWCAFLHFSSVWIFLRLLDLWVYNYHNIWNNNITAVQLVFLLFFPPFVFHFALFLLPGIQAYKSFICSVNFTFKPSSIIFISDIEVFITNILIWPLLYLLYLNIFDFPFTSSSNGI